MLPKVASAAVGTCSGVNAEGSVARPVLDPDRFLDAEYDETLNQLIDAIVRDEGPIRLDMLARQVSRAHGWQRTGHRIRDRVSNALGANECHREGQETFVWAPGAHTDRLPFRAGTDRSVREILQAEILRLADRIDGLTGQEDPALTLARQMGIARLSEDARRHLERCIEQQTD